MRQPSTEFQFPSPEQIDDLTEAVLSLNEQVRMLRLSVDEIEQELGWAIRSKVLDRLPRPEFPCDERFELPASEDRVRGFEHVCDLKDGIIETADSPLTVPNVRRQQAKLW